MKDRPLPPIAGAERSLFLEQAQRDFMDFAIIGDATGLRWTADPHPDHRPERLTRDVGQLRVSGSARRGARSVSMCWSSARSTATQIVFENGYATVGTTIINGIEHREQRHDRDVGHGEREPDRERDHEHDDRRCRC